MSDLMRVIQQADIAAVEMEKAREAVEAAKAALERAKEDFDQKRTAFDQSLLQGEEFGVPRAKLKKLIEERTSALMASGLVAATAAPMAAERAGKATKAAKPARKSKASAATEMTEANADAASFEEAGMGEMVDHSADFDADADHANLDN